ncbi:MAG: hypothetical protein AAF352_07770, partial [Pseudomonadota bacterium]
MIKILGLGTYPVSNPQGGGQFRVRAIQQCLRDAEIDYHYFCVCHNHFPGEKPDASMSAIVDAKVLENALRARSYEGGNLWPRDINNDILVDVHDAALPILETNCALMRSLHDAAQNLDPHFIQIEQHGMIEVALHLIAAGITPNARIIYSGQNDEAALYRNIMYKDSTPWTRYSHMRASAMEKLAIQNAALIFAVTQEDATSYAQHTDKPIVVACNGSATHAASVKAQTDWADRCEGFSRYMVFVSSAQIIGNMR